MRAPRSADGHAPRGRLRRVAVAGVAVLGLAFAVPASAVAATPAVAVVPAVAAATTAANVSAPGLVTGLSCSPSCDLFAKAGTDTVGGTALPVWNFTNGDTTVTGANPVIVATAGDTLSITLHDTLPVPVALSVPGLPGMAPDYTGVPAAGTKTYTLHVTRPGTYLYQAGHVGGDDPGPREVAMGLAGALVVRPAGTPNQVLDAAAPASGFDDEAVLVLSEIDPLFAAHPLSYDLRLFRGTYRLINGSAFPQIQQIGTAPSHRVLLRYVNAGVSSASMGPSSGKQVVVAQNGYPATGAALVADTIAAGSTEDAIIAVPAAGGTVAVADASGGLDTNGQVDATTLAPATKTPTRQLAFGGRIALLTTGASAPVSLAGTDTVGPDASAVSASPNPALVTAPVTVTATFTDPVVDAIPAANVVAAELFVDTLGAVGTGTAFTVPTPATTVSVTATLTPALLQALTGGPTHTVYVRGKDAVGNWGPATTVTFAIPSGGPKVTGMTLLPAVTNGTGSVSLSATGDDSVVGSTVRTMDFTVDGGCPIPVTAASPTPCRMTLNNPAGTVVAATATVPASVLAGLAEGARLVGVRVTDALGLTGTATLPMTLDTHGPTVTTSATLDPPGPNNGTLGSPVDLSSIKVQASFTDPPSAGVSSRIVGAEGFIDAPGPNGSGFVFVASDGTFDALAPAAETAYGLIPLSELTGLADGGHTVYVHAKDAAGNWGPAGTATLAVDRTRPVLSALTATQVLGGVRLAATLGNPGTAASAVVAAEAFVGTTDPGQGLATPLTQLTFPLAPGPISAILPRVPAGSRTVFVRVKDTAGNWSVPVSVTLAVRTDPLFSDTFGTTGTSWAGQPWTVTGNPTRVATTAALGLDGSRTMRTAGGALASFVTTPVLSPTSVTNPVTSRYAVRFLFRPDTLVTGGTAVAPGRLTLLSLRGGGPVTERAAVQYRRFGPASSSPAQVGLSINGAAPTSWSTLPPGTSTIRVDWSSTGVGSSATLYLDSDLATGPTAVGSTTGVPGGQTVDRAVLGKVTGFASLAGQAYLDAYTASRFGLPQ